MTALHTSSIENQRSYYKLKERNNIQLTRLFSTRPENLIFLLNETDIDVNPWMKVVHEIPGYHPGI